MKRRNLALAGVVAIGLIGEPLAGRQEPWTRKDVVDHRIDVEAQSSLVRLFESGGEAAAIASAILSAVKSGELAGIYQADQRAPAMRAQKVGKGWWQLFEGLPSERVAFCWKEPAGAAPMIVLRRGVKSARDGLDPALQGAWAGCGIPSAPPRPYASSMPQNQERTPIQPSSRGGQGVQQQASGRKEPSSTQNVSWDKQFSVSYDTCWRMQKGHAGVCRSVADIAGASDPLEIAFLMLGSHCNKPIEQWPLERADAIRACCKAAEWTRHTVDSCVTMNVLAMFAAELRPHPTEALPTIKARYADWKRRNGKP